MLHPSISCDQGFAQHLVPSVVKNAGIGDFACLKGRSGRRYVFSAVDACQVSLYENAVFALVDADGRLSIGNRPATRCDAQHFVHILEEGDPTPVMIDLAA